MTMYKIVIRTENPIKFKRHIFNKVFDNVYEIKLTPNEYGRFLSTYDLIEGKIYSLEDGVCGQLLNNENEYVGAFFIPMKKIKTKRKGVTVKDLLNSL